MKQQDFDRLKAKLGDEFEAYNNEYGVVIVEKKKDIWEGVEYAEFIDTNLKGNVYKIQSIDSMITCIDWNNTYGNYYSKCYKEMVKPSTESAYVEQLKKEAFERFGEIRDGDRFDRTGFEKYAPRVSDIESISDKYLHEGEIGFRYNKHIDSLLYKGFIIYQSGKWATKLPKRIEVEFDRPNSGMVANHYFHTIEYTFNIKRTGKDYPNPLDAGKFLASQLERYLNNEL